MGRHRQGRQVAHLSLIYRHFITGNQGGKFGNVSIVAKHY